MLQLKSTGTGMGVAVGVAVLVGVGVGVGPNVGVNVGVSVGVAVGVVWFTAEDGAKLANEPLKKTKRIEAAIIKLKTVPKRNLEFRDTFDAKLVL